MAHQTMVAAEQMFNGARADFSREQQQPLDPMLFELVAPDGAARYASSPLQGQALQAPAGQAQLQTLLGRAYWVAAADTRHGRLHIAEPRLPGATVIGWFITALLPDLALAFPFVLIPVWLAVRQGLRPLRKLADRLDQRTRDDFSPIGLNLKHAELQPLIVAFDALLARLRGAMQRERAFVQDAAHELRTPMAVIAAQAHVLMRAADDAERVQAEGALAHAIARASHLAQQLLTLAALDPNRSPELQATDLVTRTQEMLIPAAASAQAGRLELSLDAPEQLHATLDLPAYQSVLQNLLDNALRYVPPGGCIEVSLRALGAGWQLRVADNGPGIPTDEQPHIFDRFVRGRDRGAVAGTGLGLAIVRQAVQRLGGQVGLRPGLHGRGVAFEVQAPRSPPQTAP
jgi:signal transduction histidine kinase